MKTILVAGCGGSLGISIGRILRMAEYEFQLIGTDIHSDHPGLAIYDYCHIIPPVSDCNNYITSLRAIVKKYNVQAIIPISESEIIFFSNWHNRSLLKNSPFVIANDKTLSIGLDKYTTIMFFKKIGLPHPWTRLVGREDPLSLPCIIKPRSGSGGKGFKLVNEMNIKNIQIETHSNYIWQEFLELSEEEYTCGLFRSQKGEIRSIILRRQLCAGVSSRGEVIENESITKLLIRIAKALELEGSINVQLRMTSRGPMVFEINPRFSSTVVFRHLLGFKDVLWSLEDIWDMKIGDYTAPRPHTKFYRIAQEILLQPKET